MWSNSEDPTNTSSGIKKKKKEKKEERVKNKEQKGNHYACATLMCLCLSL